MEEFGGGWGGKVHAWLATLCMSDGLCFPVRQMCDYQLFSNGHVSCFKSWVSENMDDRGGCRIADLESAIPFLLVSARSQGDEAVTLRLYRERMGFSYFLRTIS